MSGHSKWAKIKHAKGAADAKRGKMFTKLIREITTAAKIGGGDINGNPRLRVAIDRAKDCAMPRDNIDRAIKKGTGELEGEVYESIMYEGYGPGGVAMLVDVLTDNKKRACSEVRHIFSKAGGNLGETGCVAWMFKKMGRIALDAKLVKEEQIMDLAINAGAEDIRTEGDELEVITSPSSFEAVKNELIKNKIAYVTAEITMIPQNYIALAGKEAEQMLNLMETLEDHDDVQNVYANFDIPDEVIEKIGATSA